MKKTIAIALALFSTIIFAQTKPETKTEAKPAKILSAEDTMKNCLAGEFGLWNYCQGQGKEKCKNPDQKMINNNCPQDVQKETHNLDGKKGAILVIKSASSNSIWIMETNTKTMIKIQ